MVHVICAKGRANELLKEIRLFVRALRTAEARQRMGAGFFADRSELLCCKVEGFVPRCLTKLDTRILIAVDLFRHIRTANQRHSQPFFMMRVIESITALHAESTQICRPVISALNTNNRALLHVKPNAAANSAIWTDGIHLLRVAEFFNY